MTYPVLSDDLKDVLATVDMSADETDCWFPVLSPALIKADAEVKQLREAVRRYGDRSRMAAVEPAELQHAIDRAFQTKPRS